MIDLLSSAQANLQKHDLDRLQKSTQNVIDHFRELFEENEVRLMHHEL